MALSKLIVLIFSLLLACGALSDTPPGIIVTCFNCGNPVARATAGTAASWFCGDYWKTTIYQSDSSLSHGIVFTYRWYWMFWKTQVWEQLQLSFYPFWDGEHDCTADYNPFFVDEETCYRSFMAPIDYCDTSGTDDKHGGYWWTGCANVTVNPNPNDAPCPNAAPNWTPPDAKVVDYYASPEQHEATSAAVREWEKSGGDYSDLKAAISQIKRDLATTEDKSLADIQKRDESTHCFDRCLVVERSLAVNAVSWFCNKYDGVVLDNLPSNSFSGNNGPISVSENYTYEPRRLELGCWPEHGIINLAVGLRLYADDSSSQCNDINSKFTLDQGTCTAGLLSAVDNCNTNTVLYKQGGTRFEECVQFTFDPTPFPNCDDACAWNTGGPPS